MLETKFQNIFSQIPYAPWEVYNFTYPRDPITLSDDDWGVQSAPQRKVLRFHETILSFGDWIPMATFTINLC